MEFAMHILKRDIRTFFSVLCMSAMFSHTDGWAFGASEVQLCSDAAVNMSISTYTDKLQEYMSDRTGAVPAWLVAKGIKKAAKKVRIIGGISGAAGELKDWCEIASSDDEVVRAAGALTKLATFAGPVGSVVSAQMKAGVETLNQGMKYISATNTTRSVSASEWNFCLRIYEPRWYWLDPLKERAAALAEVTGVYMLTKGVPLPVQSVLTVNPNDINQRGLPCYKAVFEFADQADAAYAIRVDFNNGQRVYSSIKSLESFLGESSMSLKFNATLFDQGAILYLPR